MYQRITNQIGQLVTDGPKHHETVIQKSPQGYIVGIPAEGEEAGASLSLENYDRYSVILHYLEVFNPSLIVNSSEVENYLHQCAAAMSQCLTYLEEPLALLELDTIKGLAQLRSSRPQQAPGQIIYWELNVWTAPYPRARLARYSWSTGNDERSPLYHPATVITLARLAEDLATSLARTGD
jgi:hypothetical protein